MWTQLTPMVDVQDVIQDLVTDHMERLIFERNIALDGDAKELKKGKS